MKQRRNEGTKGREQEEGMTQRSNEGKKERKEAGRRNDAKKE